jgi:DNA-binding NtrC family response regulator
VRVLVVDDDNIVLSSCVRVLENEGHAVTTATCSRSALEALERERFDVVVLDIKMPETDGVVLTMAVRQRRPNVPIVAMSGYATERTIAEATLYGARRFVTKPFLPEELVEAVRAATQKEG